MRIATPSVALDTSNNVAGAVVPIPTFPLPSMRRRSVESVKNLK